MIILDATTKSLEVALGGAVATNQLPFVASYVDITTNTFTPSSNNGETNDTTAVTLLAAPASATQRQLKYLSLVNEDTANVTVNISYNDNSTLRKVADFTLITGDSLYYTDGEGFRVFDSVGNLKQGEGFAPVETGYVAKTANYTLTTADYTVDCTANSFTLTLPTAVGNVGRIFQMKNSGGVSDIITINTTSAQTIDDQASGAITLNQYDNLTVQSDGANWIIL